MICKQRHRCGHPAGGGHSEQQQPVDAAHQSPHMQEVGKAGVNFTTAECWPLPKGQSGLSTLLEVLLGKQSLRISLDSFVPGAPAQGTKEVHRTTAAEAATMQHSQRGLSGEKEDSRVIPPVGRGLTSLQSTTSSKVERWNGR